MKNYYGVEIGDFITELEARNSSVITEATGKIFNLQLVLDKTAQDDGIINAGEEDNTPVYEVVEVSSKIGDTDGETANITNNALDVAIQDQTTEIVDYYLCNLTDETNPTSDILLNDKEITVDDVTGAVVGDCINISENGRMFQSVITGIDTNTISFSSKSDQAFTTEAKVCFGEWDLSQANGTSSDVIYKICPPTGAKWDITTINFTIVDTGASTEFTASDFGNITGGLTNPIVLRVTDGYEKNIWEISSNGGFSDRGCIYEIDRVGFFGTNEIGLTASYCIKEKGSVIRLDGDRDDYLEIIIQDNLTPLDKMTVVAQGHVVE